MKRILRPVLSRWSLTFVGTALVAALAWFFFPLVDALAPLPVRLGVIAGLLLAWAGANLLLDARRRRRDRALIDAVTAAPDPAAAAVAEETGAVREQLGAALRLLQRARGTRGYLYEQPWFAIIGPPGAGKTTALLNAGLRFPLAAEMGQGAVPGVGGTRMFDWWFTDAAVLIDTAGRYTTQDSDAVVDRAGWEAFLDLLKRTRARQPLNGIIVATGLADVAQMTDAERARTAQAIRARVKEADARLGVRLPVYLLFTKSDLIAGFTEFFDTLDRDGRGQVWGATLPLADAKEDTPAGKLAADVATEFQALVARIDTQVLDRLQAERSPERRTLIAGFPSQLASLEPAITRFAQDAFGGSRLDRGPLLRGVYFASGTQEGTPIDRLTGVLARAFGLDQKRLPSLRPEQGRSYFLGRLLSEVILGEAMLVAEPPDARRRRAVLRAAAFTAMAAAVVLALVALWLSRAAVERQVAAATEALRAYEQTASGLPLDPVNDADLPALVPLLDQAEALPSGADGASPPGSPVLSQAAKLRAAGRTVYRHALRDALLPRLVWRLEAQMRGHMQDADTLYGDTRVYLMLVTPEHLDRSLVHEAMRRDWEAAYPQASAAPIRAGLLRHLDALLAEPLPPIAYDQDLVGRAQAAFSRVTVAQRIYSRIRLSAVAQRVPPWRPDAALGPVGATVFVRDSRKGLDDGIPGFFTVDGFHEVLLPSLGRAANIVAAESWVLGPKASVTPMSQVLDADEKGVVRLYEDDYARVWDGMLRDLEVVPLRSITQAAQDLYVLASPQSPMKDLLASVARQLTLSVPSENAKRLLGTGGAAAGGVIAAASAATRVDTLFAPPDPAQVPPPPPGSEIDARYKPLRDLVGTGAGAPIDFVLKDVNDLQQEMAKLSALPAGTPPPPPAANDPGMALRVEAQRQPEPLGRWLLAMATSTTALRGGDIRQQIVQQYNGSGGPAALCALAVRDRYPFAPGAARDVPLADFARLFAPGGLLDAFFSGQLRPYADTSGATWQPQAVQDVAAPVTAADLAQFQRAARIRDLFFPNGGTTPSVAFGVTPESLDPAIRQATLDLGGTSVVSAHGPAVQTQVTWPGAPAMQLARLTLDPPPPGTNGVLQASGPWALFRLFDRARLRSGGSPEKFALSFDVGGQSAPFEIDTTLLNAFEPGLLQGFRCPAVK